MLGNDGFDREEIIRVHREATIRRMSDYEGTIPAVQDTTGVNYNTHKKKRTIEEKESFRWLEMMDKSVANIPEGVRVITVCDREGDMADLSPMSCLPKPKR
jgi:hypothetical protein